ncbi:MAG: OFA family MFS transporter [Clostridia bacterium]|nr:OFA family MFS transporter [Clostridia bacterium]
MAKFSNKWTRAAIPALLLHCSIGTVYCWSTFKEQIANYIGQSTANVEWAFSLAIFFLGMSAAFMGNVVEKNIHRSSLIAAFCFAFGLAGTALFIYLKSLIGILVCYGCIMGIGLGLGYLSPVKTLMLWFKNNKGLATGLAVAGFGAAKAIATPIMEAMMASGMELYTMFLILAGVYFVMMLIGHLLLKKPDGWHEEVSTEKDPHPIKTFFSKFKVFKDKTFIGVWLVFYINITCGLAIISNEKELIKMIGLAPALIGTICAVFNAGGRLGYSALADGLKDRNTMYKIILISEIAISLIAVILGFTNGFDSSIVSVIIVLALLFLVNAGYGGGFSNLPTLLSDHFGMKAISTIHGVALSAWAFAGLTGNQMAALIKDLTGNVTWVFVATLALYVVAMVVDLLLIKKPKEIKE